MPEWRSKGVDFVAAIGRGPNLACGYASWENSGHREQLLYPTHTDRGMTLNLTRVRGNLMRVCLVLRCRATFCSGLLLILRHVDMGWVFHTADLKNELRFSRMGRCCFRFDVVVLRQTDAIGQCVLWHFCKETAPTTETGRNCAKESPFVSWSNQLCRTQLRPAAVVGRCEGRLFSPSFSPCRLRQFLRTNEV